MAQLVLAAHAGRLSWLVDGKEEGHVRFQNFFVAVKIGEKPEIWYHLDGTDNDAGQIFDVLLPTSLDAKSGFVIHCLSYDLRVRPAEFDD